MSQPSLRQLSYLTAIEDHGSFSRAAESCHVTQSTLSAGIRELEAALGQRLVDRRGRAITLTPLGAEVAHKARVIAGDVDAIMSRCREAAAPMSSIIRLGVIPTIAPYFLPRVLPTLQKKFPRLDLQLYEDLSERLVESLREGRLDLVLMAFPYDTPGLETLRLFDEEFFLACPRGAAPKTKTLRPEDLKNMNLLLLEDGHCLRDHALSACQYLPPRQRKTFSATSLPTLIQMVRHGYGATLLPAMVAHETASTKNLALIPFKKPAPSRQIGLAWQPGNPRTGDMKTIAATMRQLQKPGKIPI